MKRSLKTLLLAGAAIALAVPFVIPNSADAIISGSSHDFQAQAWAAGEICKPCHTPHGAKVVADAPLWNHTTTTATFAPYTSSSMNVTPGQPAGRSVLCLSCHDGTVGLEAFGTVTPGTIMISGTPLVGTDLTNDHPISFNYDTSQGADTGAFTARASVNGNIKFFGSGGDQMECASCHAVHNDGVAGRYMLRMTRTASAICLACHIK